MSEKTTDPLSKSKNSVKKNKYIEFIPFQAAPEGAV
jgi:hypothetical protein